MATSRTDIISETSISFMRSMNIAFNIKNAKPNTTMYAFFDGISVDSDITQTGKTKGVKVVTDASGEASGVFFVAAAKYNTGTKTLKFQDDPKFTLEHIPGSTVSTAAADFTTSGIMRSTQNTVTERRVEVQTYAIDNNIIAAPPPPPPPPPPPVEPFNWFDTSWGNNSNVGSDNQGGASDPLAQSFFTYGVTGGLTVTQIDLFFKAKTNNSGVPVTLEIRELVNGYPGPKLVSTFARVVKKPIDIIVTLDSSIATPFIFDVPIFLPENKDYCFVILSNSDEYFVWTAKIGEKSQETGATVSEQPFIGTMFKSENNITWLADSTEDIKFVIHRAVFDTNGANLVMRVKADKILIFGKNMSGVNLGKTVSIKFDHLHGLNNGDKVRIIAPTGTSTYRGVTAAQLTGLYSCAYIDEYNVSIQILSGAFTSTGTLEIPGIVNAIQIDTGGSGYTTTPTISIVGACTTTATATVTTTGGVITGVTITNRGAGYISKPTLVLTGNGSGASLALISETIVQVETNRVFDEVNPRLASFAPANTSLVSTLKTVATDYSGQGASMVAPNVDVVMSSKSILVSDDNNTAFLPGQNPTEFIVNLSSNNPNISPIVSISQAPTLECRAYVINNQSIYETTNPNVTQGSGSISSIVINVGGSSYSSTVVNISAPNVTGGTQASATAVLTGGVVTGVNVTNIGSGYTQPPVVTMNQVSANPATIIPILTSFNTELLPTGGSAKSRYITKQISLNTVSSGAIIYASAYSSANSSFDIYIRTSLRSDNSAHVSLPWKMMTCDVSRNRSIKPDELLDYTFYINNLNLFDVYDIKIVLRSSDRKSIPYIDNYRSIILAT